MRTANMRSKSTFLRHMIVYGAVYDVDYAYLREYNYLLGKIGENLNQIAKRINETRSVYQTDMDAVMSKTPYGNDAYELIRNNDVRDEQIIRDVANCVRNGRTPVVLTKFVDHARKLSEKLKKYADRLILLTGADGTKACRSQVAELNAVADSESLILVGTGSLLGEGPKFDKMYAARSPRLNNQKVNRIIAVLGKSQESGVKVTIIRI